MAVNARGSGRFSSCDERIAANVRVVKGTGFGLKRYDALTYSIAAYFLTIPQEIVSLKKSTFRIET